MKVQRFLLLCAAVCFVPFVLAGAPWTSAQVVQDSTTIATDESPDENSSSDQSSAGGPRKLFAVLGIDQQPLKQLEDGTVLEPVEWEILVRILSRLNRFGDEAIDRWRHDSVPWQTIADDPDSHRLEIYLLAGRVVDVQTFPFPSELADRFEVPRVYRLSLIVDSWEQPLTVYTLEVPKRWRAQIATADSPVGDSPPNEPVPTNDLESQKLFTWDEKVRLSGWFVKLGKTRHDQPTFLFVTPRIGWFPDATDVRLGVTADQLALAARGMDISRLDEAGDETRLGVHDREAFYQLIGATDLDAASRSVGGNATTNLQQLFADPKSQRGNRFTFRGVARRAIRIQVDDPDIRRRFGLDHYYEVELFVGLERTIRVLASKEDQAGTLFDSYPITFCTRQLPEGMPVGESIQEEVEVTGHFLKLWAYTVRMRDESSAGEGGASAADNRQRKQVSPLLIGPPPVWYPSDATAPSAWAWRWTAAIVAGLGIVYWGLWRLARGDRRRRQVVREERDRLPPHRSLDDLPEVPDGPDFSGLD